MHRSNPAETVSLIPDGIQEVDKDLVFQAETIGKRPI